MTTGDNTTFDHTDPSWRIGLALPQNFLSPELVTPGDVVYTRRLDRYQRLTALAGDTWRHVGIVATIAGFPWLIDMGHGGYAARPFTTVLNVYDTVAIQRLDPCGNYCHHKLLNNIALQMNFPKNFYHRRELAAMGLNSVLRLPTFHERNSVQAAEQRLRRSLRNRKDLDDRAVCTTPIARGLGQLCEQHEVHLDALSVKKSPPQEPETEEESTIFAMPDDVWRALQDTTSSYWIKKNGHQPEVDINLTTNMREEVSA